MNFKGRFLLILSGILFTAIIIGISSFYFIKFNLLSSVFIALGVSIFVGISLSGLLKEKEDIETELEIPVLGYIEKMKDRKGVSNQLVTNLSPDSSVHLEYRMLWENMQKIVHQHGKLRTILVTSTKSGEGKTTTSLNLSIVAAQNQFQTLYINADFRSPMNRELLGVRNFKGLAGYLKGHATIEEIIENTSIPHLKIITSGTFPLHPEELLESQKMDELLESLKAQFDIIIIDSPALLNVTDGIILSKKADGCLFVVNGDGTSKKQAFIGKEKLIQAKANIVGIIVNNKVIRKQKPSRKQIRHNKNEEKTKIVSKHQMMQLSKKHKRSRANW